jgi:pimeloyl-ACP methyl ester carboxylesterase
MPTLTVDGVPIHYEETGSGHPILCLIHGAGGNALSWIRQLEGLADAARVIAIDLPGHGQSGGDGCSSIDGYATAVKAFVEGAGLGKIVLGGHSMGGAVSQSLALARPELIERLILVGTGARLRVLPAAFERLRADYAEGCAFLNSFAFSPGTDEGLREGARTAMLMNRPEVTIGDFTACNSFDLMDRLGAIKAPTLVICGRDDQLTPPKYSDFLAQRIPQARLTLVEQAGHFVHLEQPDRVNAAIRQFLALAR